MNTETKPQEIRYSVRFETMSGERVTINCQGSYHAHMIAYWLVHEGGMWRANMQEHRGGRGRPFIRARFRM